MEKTAQVIESSLGEKAYMIEKKKEKDAELKSLKPRIGSTAVLEMPGREVPS